MLRKELVAIILILFSVGAFAEDQYVPGELLVKFREGAVKVLETQSGARTIRQIQAASASIRMLNEKYKLRGFKQISEKGHRTMKTRRTKKLVQIPDFSHIYLLRIDTNESVMSAVEDYKNDPAVEYTSPNYIRKISVMPDDPFYVAGGGNPNNDPNQWGLYKIGLVPMGSGESGWDITTGDATVKVAVLDTGIDSNHEDLVGRVDTLEAQNLVITTEPLALDDDGHGTHVAGIIGARTNNIIPGIPPRGVAGVDWSCSLIPIKAFDSNGQGNDDDIIAGILWAVSKEANVINMSFGGPPDSGLQDALNFASTMETVLVAAAGNENSSRLSYPAAYSGVIAVAATDPNDVLASYSNYGTWVDISAPGGDIAPGTAYYLHDILSTYPFDKNGTPSNNSYAWLDGTSMATPFVSGVAALLLAKYPGITPEAVTRLIMDYSDGIDSINPSRRGLIGKGRINAFASLGGLHCHISDPANGSIVIGTTTITGNASGEGFDHYTVVYGLGINPTSWTTLETLNQPLLHSTLATLDVTGLDAYVTVKLSVNDLSTTESKITFHAGSLDPPLLLHKAEYGPNPFNPNKGKFLIKYDLTKNADVYLYFFTLTGNLIGRKFYAAGTEGGNQGTNRVYWDGQSDLGGTVANGVYLMKIFSEDRTIGDGKIMVLK